MASATATMQDSHPEVDLVPGTEIIRVTDESHHDHDVLIPRPTSDPHDPLNWAWPWKYMAAAVQALFCILSIMTSLAIAPMYPLLQAEFGLSSTQLNLLTGAAVLLQGYSNFVLVPLTNVFGRRFVAIMLAAIAVVTSIWEARATSYKSLFASRIVNGFSVSATETMMVQVIADMFFLHERGSWMGLFYTSTFGGVFLGPVISGNISARHGWRSYFWLSFATSTLSLVALIFGFPETKWHREPEKRATVAAATAAANSATPSTPTELKETALHDEGRTSDDGQSPGPLLINKGRPSKAAYRLIMRPDPEWKRFIFLDVISCARIFLFPIVLWFGISLAGTVNMLLLWNMTQSAVLSAPPYNFGVAAVGYSNFAFLAGGIVGLCTAGPISDWYVRWASRRNNNVREPEFRLPVLIPYFVLAVVGLVVGACAEQNKWHWALIVVVGYGFTGLTATSVPTITTAYAVDSYKAMAGEIMVVATVFKNTCGFAMSYWVPELIAREGYLNPAMVQLGLFAGPVALALPLYFFGKSLRRLTRNSWVHKMEAEI